MLRDRRQAWEMQPDGAYLQLHPGEDASPAEAQGSHAHLMEIARRRTKS